MTFHKSYRAKYIRSGCKLHKETLQTLAEYFNSIYDSQMSDGTFQHHQLNKVCADMKREMHHKLEERYACKLHHFVDHRKSNRLRRHDTTMDIIINVSTLSVVMAMDAALMRVTERVPLHARTRILSLATCTASMPSTSTRNAVQTLTIKLDPSQVQMNK